MEVYSADRSLKGKLRRRYARLVNRKPARLTLDRPMVTFGFDDPPATAAREGAAILEARGLRGTYFVAAGLAGQDSAFGLYATDDDTRRLQAAGHEIACHTFSHLDCGKADGATIAADVARNTEMLRAMGVEASTFAYPYGDVSPVAKRMLEAQFSLLRALHHGLVETGTDLNQAPAVGIEGEDGEALAGRWLDEAAERKAWLILFTHDVQENPSPFGCTPEALARLADKALALGFEVVTAAEGARRAA
ncbi:MAG: polysaccharide deacetylase family protein [Alphaproteobacteria bacterium]